LYEIDKWQKFKSKAAKPQLSVVSYQLSTLEVILKFEDFEVWKKSSRLCADLYKHFQDIKDFGDPPRF